MIEYKTFLYIKNSCLYKIHEKRLKWSSRNYVIPPPFTANYKNAYKKNNANLKFSQKPLNGRSREGLTSYDPLTVFTHIYTASFAI